MRITRFHRLCALVVTFAFVFNIVGCAGSWFGSGRERAAATAGDVDTAADNYLGDVDGDGAPSVADAIAILRIVVGLDPARELADCDGDGAAGVADAIAVLRCVVGLAAWPIGRLHAITVDLPADGPAHNDIDIVVGGQTVVQPDAGGTVSAALTGDATCTLFAIDSTADEAMLLAVVPPSVSTSQAAAPTQLSASTTVNALLFFRLGGWMLPQDRQAALLDLFQRLPQVQTFVTEFDAAYEANGRALRSMETDAALQAAFQDALDAASAAFDASSLADDLRAVLGIITADALAAIPQDLSANPWSAEGVDLSFNDRTATATNNKALYRWAEVTDAASTLLGWNVLPARSWPFSAPRTVLRPNPLPATGPHSLHVTGGLADYDGDIDFKHVIPVGMTASIRIIIPLISCIVGVQSVSGVDRIGDLFDFGEYDTGHPLVDWTLTNLVWDAREPAASLGKPVPDLIQRLSVGITNGRVDVVKVLTDWTLQKLLPAIALHVHTLAAAVFAEFGGQVALSVIINAVGVFTAPWVLAVIKAAMIAQAVITIAPALWDLCAVRWDAAFAIYDSGGGGPDPFRVTLNWDLDNDIDLHVFTSGAHSFYANQTIAAGSLDDDDVDGYGPEHFTTVSRIPGTYYVAVNYYSDPRPDYSNYGRGRTTTAYVRVDTPSEVSSYAFTLREPNGNSGYPVRWNTWSWRRVCKIVVGWSGSVTVAPDDGSTALGYDGTWLYYSTVGRYAYPRALKPYEVDGIAMDATSRRYIEAISGGR